ncbi:MAG: FAD/NAD(P)-binding protein [Cyclobacteriaceae bacterium]
MNEVPVVAVIGGGASGMLAATHLLRHCDIPIKIVVINSGSNFGTGVAYHSASDKHLLNVVAGKMSVFPDAPNHFVKWLIEEHSFSDIEIETLSSTYLPRRIYGEYLTRVWQKALEQKSETTTVEMIANRALNIEKTSSNKFVIQLIDLKKIEADHIILATGNAAPRNPAIADMGFYQSKKYFNNPWWHSSVENLDHSQDVLIIGNGLTMADTVLSLVEQKHKGTIHSISPHGFGILQHRHNGVPYNGLIRELKDVHSLHELVNLFNKHIKKIRRLGLSAEPVIDSLRPRTQSLWISFTVDEKKKFMARLRHLWGVARHRLPIQTYDTIQRLKIDGKLKVWAGKLINMAELNDSVKVDFFDKKTREAKSLTVGRVINCTGPEIDLGKMNDKLFNNLLASGMIISDPLKMGLDADPKTLEVKNKKHEIVSSFFALGGLLRGLLWESTAMGEIRAQAMHIADQIIAKEKAKAPKSMASEGGRF